MVRLIVPFSLLALATPASAQRNTAGCTAATAHRLIVTVRGLRAGGGGVRVQLYDAAGFLEKGRWLARVEASAEGKRTIEVCVPVPRPGTYGIAVRHDANANGKSDGTDGGGFSRDPKLSLLRLKPAFAQVAVPVAAGTSRVAVTMNYRHGLSVGPER
ncbi:DUF2141 domain-containing protein [Sphingomonas sp. RP10(2022)]|uniref:DUF2141 domain-containing protein n=1 Tax=Sphingomonas liriopis TaxID=2949094 RepID=A0A9X2HTL6_9SPHN|nr:DUF2141 domain-containing protein [Sphingomonas liriopis]MCP3735239.1 DUF2141 domain-containing protein [Sphingomonas liriopis]